MKLKELLEGIKDDTLLYLVNAGESKVLYVDEALYVRQLLEDESSGKSISYLNDAYVNKISLSPTNDGIQIKLEYNN